MTAIKLFVDDERDAFNGWTLARNVREAMQYFDYDPDEGDEKEDVRITHLSLDWYMGNGGHLNGDFIASEMIGRVFYLKLPIFDELKVVMVHSSDREQAIKIARKFEEAQKKGTIPKDCRIKLNPNCRLDYGDKA